MSDLIVKIVQVNHIKPHPNADRLEIVDLGGWNVVVAKDTLRAGDLMVHVPPDAMVPRHWADQFGVTRYLTWKKNAQKGRVRATSMRGVTSHGFLVSLDDKTLGHTQEGDDVAAVFDISKYEPANVGRHGGQEVIREDILFHRYTDIQNLRAFKDKLDYNEPLVVTEKLHGSSSRVGWIRGLNNEFSMAIGSHRCQLKNDAAGVFGLPLEAAPARLSRVFQWIMRSSYGERIKSVIFFGEIFEPGMQDLHYGLSKKEYRVFDVAVNGKYLNWNTLTFLKKEMHLPLVPQLALGMFDFEDLVEIAQGQSTIDEHQIREGIVVRPMHEKTWGKGDLDPRPKRMIFKLISDAYMTRKRGTEFH